MKTGKYTIESYCWDVELCRPHNISKKEFEAQLEYLRDMCYESRNWENRLVESCDEIEGEKVITTKFTFDCANAAKTVLTAYVCKAGYCFVK